MWILIHAYYFLLFSWLSKKLSQLPNLDLDRLLSRFYGSAWTKNLLVGCMKQILTALLFGEWEKIIVPSVKFNIGLLFTSALRVSVKSRLRLNFTSGTIIFHHSPHEQSIFVYYTHVHFVVTVGKCWLCMRWWVSCMQHVRVRYTLRTCYYARSLFWRQRR